MTILSHDIKLKTEIESLEDAFARVIKNRLGLMLRHQKKELNKTILNACLKYDIAPEEYLKNIKNCSEDSPFLEHLVAGVTIGETYFFRDKNQMRLLQDEVLPELINQKRKEGNLSLRIWSAGCSSGEEIYSIAMLVYELIKDPQHWSINLLGTDINTKSLQKAILGNYNEWSMRSISLEYKNKFFLEQNRHYQLKPEIRNKVKFDYLNLIEGAFPSMLNGTNAQDLILCRNVLIYFDSDHVSYLMKKFSQSLCENSYLLLGASDPVDLNNPDFVFHYKKGALFSKPKLFTNIMPMEVLPLEKKIIEYNPSKKPIYITKTKRITEDTVNQMMTESQWQEILKLEEEQFSFVLNAKSLAAANMGKLTQALDYCEKSLALESTNKVTYLNNALILIELNRISEAEVALRKALFLDHKYVVAHFQLGLLLLRSRNKAAGLKSLRNALMIVAGQDPAQQVIGFRGLTNAHLKEILDREIALYDSLGSNGNANEDSKN